jgi:glycosyltransferase involved in cell wall biosynthesis
MDKKKVLIITYYWPPSAGVGVQRWLKFAKYLPQNGWQPTIITPKNPQFNVSDATLTTPKSCTVHHVPIWEPFDFFAKITGNKGKEKVKQGLVLEGSKKSFFEKTIVWMRGNVMLPDPRIFWRKNVISFLDEHLKTEHYDLLVTTGPPHSMHLIGLAAKQKFDLRWIADFRDPWSQWDILPELNTGTIAMYLHKKWEKEVLTNADAVLCTSSNQADMFDQLGAKNVHTITNGYDADDLPDLRNIKPNQDVFEMVHLGLLNELRNPETLWLALEELLVERHDFATKFKLTLGGIVGDAVKLSIDKHPLLAKKTVYLGYLPHKEMLISSAKAGVLLIVQNKSNSAPLIIPAKIFEYLAVGRPILMVGPTHCHAAEIVHHSKAGYTVAHDALEDLKHTIIQLFNNYQTLKTMGSEAYSRENLTTDLSLFFNNICQASATK